MNTIDITIPEPDNGSSLKLENFLRDYMCNYEKISTKDGLVYVIEFKNESNRDRFLNDWSL